MARYSQHTTRSANRQGPRVRVSRQEVEHYRNEIAANTTKRRGPRQERKDSETGPLREGWQTIPIDHERYGGRVCQICADGSVLASACGPWVDVNEGGVARKRIIRTVTIGTVEDFWPGRAFEGRKRRPAPAPISPADAPRMASAPADPAFARGTAPNAPPATPTLSTSPNAPAKASILPAGISAQQTRMFA